MASTSTSPQRTAAIVFIVLGGIVAGLLALAVGLGFVLYLSSGDKAQTKRLVRELFEAIDRGDEVEYYRYNVSNELGLNEPTFNQLCESVRTHLGTLQSIKLRTFATRHESPIYYIDAIYVGRFDQASATIETQWVRHGDEDESWYLIKLAIKSPRLDEAAAIRTCKHCGHSAPAKAGACKRCGKLFDEKDIAE